MPHHETVHVTGSVTHVFAHRFVLNTGGGAILADLTPHGAEQIALRVGDEISLEGEKHPSEVKAQKVTRGHEAVTIGGPPHPPHDEPLVLTAADAMRLASQAGYRTRGEPRRMPRHFEILGEKDGRFAELHVHAEGLRHAKSVSPTEPKWSAEMKG